MTPTTKVATKTLDEPYDRLSQSEMDIHDQIVRDFGWQPQSTDDGWIATKGKKIAGPFSGMVELRAAVKAGGKDINAEPAAGQENVVKTVKVKQNSKGQGYIPGTEPIEIKELTDAGLAYRATTVEILSLQEQQKREKAIVIGLLKKHNSELQVDAETGERYYVAGGDIKIWIEVNESEKLKTKQLTDED